jgi:hypothetical protein
MHIKLFLKISFLLTQIFEIMDRKYLGLIFSLFTFLGFLAISGCNFYKPITKTSSPENRAALLDSLSQKIFILHTEKDVFLMRELIIDKKSAEISGTLEEVPPQHLTYINDKKSKFRYRGEAPFVLYEVHVYSHFDGNFKPGDKVTFPVSFISKIVNIERDDQRSNENTLLTVIWIPAGLLVAFWITMMAGMYFDTR